MALRQTAAALQLVARAALRSESGTLLVGKHQLPVGGVVRVGILLVAARAFWDMGASAAGGRGATAAGWATLGMVLTALGAASMPRVGGRRAQARPPLEHPWLLTLPVRSGPLIVAATMRFVPLFALQLTFLCALLRVESRPPLDAARVVAAGGLVYAAPLALGHVAMSAARRHCAPGLRRALTVLLGVLGSLGTGVMFVGAAPGAFDFGTPVFDTLGAWLMNASEEFPWATFHVAAGLLALCAVVARRHNRTAFDTSEHELAQGADASHSPAPVRSPSDVESLGFRRERQWVQVLAVGVGVTLMLGLMLAASREAAGKAITGAALGSQLAAMTAGIVLYFGAFLAHTSASRAVLRDAAARPLLAALPITPTETLRGKTRQVLRSVAFLPPLLLAFAALAPPAVQPTALVLTATTTLGLGLMAQAAVSVAFLTRGVGAPQGASAGLAVSLDAMLLYLPLYAFASPAVLGNLPMMAAFALLTVAARRAAARAVTWFDEARDDDAATTVAWRALLLLPAFMLVQGVVAGALGDTGKLGYATAVSYTLGATVLVLLTLSRRRRDFGPLPLFPARPFVALLAIPGGVGTLTAGMWLAQVLSPYWQRFGIQVGAGVELAGPGELAALGVAVCLVAPVAEEIYFRGFLQPALALELGRHARWAPWLAAFAFAAVHPAPSFPAVFLLGLLASLLYARTRSLLPGIAAHAAHNLMALLA